MSVLNYTNKLIDECYGRFTSSEAKRFNSQRRGLLDAWKAHFKNLGTFNLDVDNKDGLLKEGINPDKIKELSARAKAVLAFRRRQAEAMKIYKKQNKNSPVQK